jgi:hypothetical protein
MKWYWYRERDDLTRALSKSIGVKVKIYKPLALKGLFFKDRIDGRNNLIS